MKNILLAGLAVLFVFACKKESAYTYIEAPSSATFDLNRIDNLFFTNDSCLLIAGERNLMPTIIKTNYNFEIKWTKNTDDWENSPTTEPGTNLSGHSLVLNDIIPLDSGKYVCFLSGNMLTSFVIELNGHGEQIRTVSLPDVKASKTLKTSDKGYFLYLKDYSFMTKTDENYHTIWQKSTLNSVIQKIVLTSDGNYAGLILPCSIDGGCGFIHRLSKFDSGGNILFSKSYFTNEKWNDLVQMPDQGFLLIGYAVKHDPKTDIYDTDYKIVKTNASGDSLWTKTFGDASEEMLNKIIMSNQNEFVILGLSGHDYPVDNSFKSTIFKINTEGQILDSISTDRILDIVYSPLHYYFTAQKVDSAHFKINRIDENMMFKKE